MKDKKMSYSPYKEKNDKYHRLGTAMVFIIFVLGIAFVCFAYRTQKNATKQYLNEVAVQSADRIRTKIYKDLNILEATAKSFSEIGENDEDLIAFLLQNEYEMYKDKSVIRLSYVKENGVGIEACDDGEPKKFALPPETGYFNHALNTGETVYDITKDPVTGENAYICSIPVIKNGRPIAVHHGVYMLSEVNRTLNASYFGSNGHSYIIKKDGTPLFGSGIGINSDEFSYFEKGGFFNDSIADITQKIADERKGSMIISHDSKDYWVTFVPVNYSDWFFVLVVPNSSINNSSDKVLVLSAVIFLCILIAAVLFLRHMDLVQIKNQNELYELACIDEVTDIFNKTGFAEFMGDALRSNEDKQFAFVYVDIINFKAYNDLFGYREGNKLLRYTADVLISDLKENECCARFNGDNFYILLEMESHSELERRINDLMSEISEYSVDSESSYDVLCHCGIFEINDLNRDREVDFYVDRAKMALASLTKSHKNEFVYYDENIRKSLVFEAELENDLKQGLENEEFKVYIQPKYNVMTQKLAGGEALIRWQHPTKGFLTPNRFVDIFEKNGQITEIDFYVLEQVCKMQKTWVEKGFEPIVISVNQSRMHLYKSDYLDRLQAMIKKYGMEPKNIELEITETVAMSNSDLMAQAVDDLHELGFRVSIDDFGSGQSSLNVLKDIAIDVIKLDRAFFISLTNSPKGKEIISTVIGMASRLNIETVSEGIETDEQFKFIKQAGCDLVQGFLFGKPMPLEEFSELFEKSLG